MTELKNRFVCIHGHFYQPPRENAWLETVEEQESAHPWHDWNARINFECYAPNAAARILDNTGAISKIRNNYNRISFNFGPTLLSWMQENDPEAYALLLAADQKSSQRFGGHGSALAQVYSHLIMPLANYRDKVTQVTWGIKDFQHRFDRLPEGMWLAETAVDTETLEVLAANDIKFTILAPRQAKAVRQIDAKEWNPVSAESLDTRRPYWCQLPSGRKIAVFFYHGGVSQAVAFERLLNNGKLFAERVLSILDRSNHEAQLAHIATDGESYGHHHRFGEMALADALNYIEDKGLATLTNYAQFLQISPPNWEVELHENSSWSCVHGVERWRNDCGCNSGKPGWHQKWRKPLRQTLDFLRDKLIPIFEKETARLLIDPWAARNDYITVVLNQHSESSIRNFIDKHARRLLSTEEKTQVLRLLEMQRHAMLMYTSCGWFFDEISGIETNQILQYALRAMDYAQELTGIKLHEQFEHHLANAPSNVFTNGVESYRQQVVPSKVTLERVAMHFAVASLFEEHPEKLNLFNYTNTVLFFEKIEAGTPSLASGRLLIRSKLTGYERMFSFAVLYLGQQHIIGSISDAMNSATFDQMWELAAKHFRKAGLGETISALQKYFGPDKFTLSSLFKDEKIKIIREITGASMSVADAGFKEVYKDNYQLITGLETEGLPVPDSWRNVAAYVLNSDLLQFFQSNETPDPRRLKRIAEDIKRWEIKLTDRDAVQHAISTRIYSEITKISFEPTSLPRVKWLIEVISTVQHHTDLQPDIWRSQNVFYLFTKGYRKGLWNFANEDWRNTFEQLATLLKVQLK